MPDRLEAGAKPRGHGRPEDRCGLAGLVAAHASRTEASRLIARSRRWRIAASRTGTGWSRRAFQGLFVVGQPLVGQAGETEPRVGCACFIRMRFALNGRPSDVRDRSETAGAVHQLLSQFARRRCMRGWWQTGKQIARHDGSNCAKLDGGGAEQSQNHLPVDDAIGRRDQLCTQVVLIEPRQPSYDDQRHRIRHNEGPYYSDSHPSPQAGILYGDLIGDRQPDAIGFAVEADNNRPGCGNRTDSCVSPCFDRRWLIPQVRPSPPAFPHPVRW